MKLLPLGTVIKTNNNKAIVIGYASNEKDGNETYGYFAVSYPIGFTNTDKVAYIPHDSEFEIVAEGYKTDASEKVLELVAKSLEMMKSVPLEKIEDFNRLYKDAISNIEKGAIE